MSVEQQVWSLTDGVRLREAKAPSEKQIEDLLAANIEVLNDEWLVVGRQVPTDGGYIDLLCIDPEGALVVVELKRDLTPREVTAQAIDYASCVAGFTNDRLASVYAAYSARLGSPEPLNEAFERKFGVKLNEDSVNNAVKIVIVATRMDGSTERIIRYLSDAFGVDINILFFSVLEFKGSLLLSRAWLKEPDEVPAAPVKPRRDWNGEYYFSFGEGESRKWEEARRYGFICAGGGKWYSRTLASLQPGCRVWVNVPDVGYVGVCRVKEAAVAASEAALLIDGEEVPFFQAPLNGSYHKEMAGSDEQEYVIMVEWLVSVPLEDAVHELGFFGNQNSACRPTAPSWDFTLGRLRAEWGLLTEGGV